MVYKPPAEVLANLRSEFGVPSYIGSEERIFQGTDDGFGTNRIGRALAMEKAAEAGVSTAGAKYFPTLADRPGDPNAWCRDKADIRKQALAIGADVDSPGFQVKSPLMEVPDDKPYEVAADIVESEVADIIADDHGGEVTQDKYRELKHTVKEKRSGRGGDA